MLTPVPVRSWLRGGVGQDEEVVAVEAQLLDRLADVVEGAVVLGLARALAVDRRVPAPAQLLERRHVDAAVVEVLVELVHVAGEEAAVGADAVAAERCDRRLRHVLLHVLERGLLGGGDARSVERLDLGQQSRLRVHLAHEVVHARERVGVGVHDELDAVVERGERRSR